MKRDIVKPIPPRNATPTMWVQLILRGRAAIPSLTASQANSVMPTAFPTSRPSMTPEVTGHLMDRLLAEGARDVQFYNVQMKKNRPGLSLRVLCTDDARDRLAEIILRETSTFGLRIARSERLCLARRMESVETSLGSIAVKVGLWGDDVLKVSPEYESCRAAAEASGRPLRDVFEVVRSAIQDRYFS